MKKIMAVLSAMFVLACGMMMTGCELKEALENLVGPKDKWCEKEFTYKTDDAENPQTSTITCYMFYSDKGIVAGTSGYKADFTVPAGLTLVAIADKSQGCTAVAHALAQLLIVDKSDIAFCLLFQVVLNPVESAKSFMSKSLAD